MLLRNKHSCLFQVIVCSASEITVQQIEVHVSYWKDLSVKSDLHFQDGVEVSHCLNFDPHGTGAEVWNELQAQGKFVSKEGKYSSIFKCKLK